MREVSSSTRLALIGPSTAGSGGFSGAQGFYMEMVSCLLWVIIILIREFFDCSIMFLPTCPHARLPACPLAIYINEALMYAGINNVSNTGHFSTMTASKWTHSPLWCAAIKETLICCGSQTEQLVIIALRFKTEGISATSLHFHWHNYPVIKLKARSVVLFCFPLESLNTENVEL